MKYWKILFMLELLMILTTTSALMELEVPIDEVHFPDSAFRSYLLSEFDTNADGAFSQNEIDQVLEIKVVDKDITTIKGIEYFTKLEVLACSGNRLSKLDVSHNNVLTYLNCYDNQLTELDVSHNNVLTDLDCSNNQLTELDVSHNIALTNLDCSNNQLTEFDLPDDSSMRDFDCSNNQLKTLNLGKRSSFVFFSCHENQLAELDLSNVVIIKQLYCDNNRLNELNLSNCPSLHELDCTNNNITRLDLRGLTDLDDLDCDAGVQIIVDKIDDNSDSIKINAENFPDNAFRAYISDKWDKNSDNELTNDEIGHMWYMDLRNLGISSLKGIEFFVELDGLNCSHNDLTKLDLRKLTKLRSLECQYNHLTKLDIRGLSNLYFLDCFSNELSELELQGCNSLLFLNCQNNNLSQLNVQECPFIYAAIRDQYYFEENGYIGYSETDNDIGGDDSVQICFDRGVSLNNGKLASVLKLPKALRTIEKETFENTKINVLEIDESFAGGYIGSRAFANCKDLVCVNFNQDNITISPDAFEGCDDLFFLVDYNSHLAGWAKAHGIHYVVKWLGE